MSQTITCRACQTHNVLRPEESVCQSCGAKLRETMEEMDAAIAVQQAAHSIKRARLWLLIAALLTLAIGALFYVLLMQDWAFLPDEGKLPVYLGVGLGGVLLGLWALAAIRPLEATALATLIQVARIGWALVQSPSAFLLSPLGGLFNLLVLAALISGVRAASKHRRLTRR